jgi:hypothetical protein
MDKTAALTIWTVTLFPKSLADFSLVSRMSLDISEFRPVMGELALDAILASARLLKSPTHFGLVQGYSLVRASVIDICLG